MKSGRVVWISVTAFAFAVAALGQDQVEPKAGAWHTWVLRSGAEVSVPPPPGPDETAQEIQWLKDFASERDEQALRQIRFWDAGPAAWRWIEMLALRFERGSLRAPAWIPTGRSFTSAWQSTMQPLRAGQTRSTRTTAAGRAREIRLFPGRWPTRPARHTQVRTLRSPEQLQKSLPISYPAEAELFRSLADEVARSRLHAGVEYPSDSKAGLELGRAIAARVVDYAANDGSGTTWTGTVPTTPGLWTVGRTPFFHTRAPGGPVCLPRGASFVRHRLMLMIPRRRSPSWPKSGTSRGASIRIGGPCSPRAMKASGPSGSVGLPRSCSRIKWMLISRGPGARMR